MPDQTNTPNPQSQGGSDGSDKTKLWAGKYKTPEEMEIGYKEAERLAHTAAERASQWEEIAKQKEANAATTNYGQGGTYVPVAQNPSQEQATAVLTNFYRDPVGTIRQIKDAAVSEAEDRILKRQKTTDDHLTRVNGWLEKNQDLKPHGDLLSLYVGQTDGRLAIETRLDTAAKRTRERLVELRGGASHEANPDPGSYVPGPSGSREGAPAGRPATTQAPTTGESQLAAYAAERNTGRVKRPGTHNR